jgi:iron(III) transport system permease protein
VIGRLAFALALLAFAAIPLASVLVGFDPRHLPELAPAAWGTLQLALGTGALTLGIGVPVGLALARVRSPLVRALAVLPYAVPPYVTTLAWITLANPTNGWLTALAPVDVYGLAGMIGVLGLHLVPIVALPVADAARRVDPALVEAARLAGATPRRALRDVTLPMVRPAALTGAGLAATVAAASFGVPYLLSAPSSTPVPVLTTRIARAIDAGPEARPEAVAGAVALLGIGLALPLIARALDRRPTTGRPGRPPDPHRAADTVVVAYVVLAAGVPLVVLAVTSLLVRYGDLGSGWTLAAWTGLAVDGRTRWAVLRSLALATAAATVATGIGALLAHAAARAPRDRALAALLALARAPYAVPGSVLALGLLLAWSQDVRVVIAERITLVLALADTAWLLGIAYTVKLLALPLDGVGAAARALPPAWEEAARLAGASPLRTFRDVTVPLLRPAIVSSWWLVHLAAACEVTLSVLLKGPDTEVLGTRLFTLQTYAAPQAASALAVAIGLVAVATRVAARERP